jgi:hypothetical protein
MPCKHGEFNRLSQHLNKGGVVWEEKKGGCKSKPAGLRCIRQADLAEWPLLVMSTHGSARAWAGAVRNLLVDPYRMRVNIDAMRATLAKGAADEWFDLGLAKHAGELALVQLAGLQGQ